MRVLFLTLGGPTTATTMGGGSKGVRSTTGKWSFLVCMSSVRLTDRAARTVDLNVTALVFWGFPSPEVDCVRCFFLSALGPDCSFGGSSAYIAPLILSHGWAFTCLGALILVVVQITDEEFLAIRNLIYKMARQILSGYML